MGNGSGQSRPPGPGQPDGMENRKRAAPGFIRKGLQEGSACAQQVKGSRPRPARNSTPPASPPGQGPHGPQCPLTGALERGRGEMGDPSPLQSILLCIGSRLHGNSVPDHKPRGQLSQSRQPAGTVFFPFTSHLRPRVQKAGEALPRPPARPHGLASQCAEYKFTKKRASWHGTNALYFLNRGSGPLGPGCSQFLLQISTSRTAPPALSGPGASRGLSKDWGPRGH